MSNLPLLGYGRQVVDDDDIAAVSEALRSDFLTSGPLIPRLEGEIAARAGAKYAVAVANGTAALHIACLAAGMGPGKVGLTQPLTFVASANAMHYCGAESELGDIDPQGLTLAPSAIRAAISSRPDISVVMPVHFAGLAALNAEIREAAAGHVVIEDACHAFGGAYADGRPIGCGAYADMTVFSFHPVKPVTTGEGGAVVTNDGELYRRLKLFREHGIERNSSSFECTQQATEDGQSAPWYYEQQVLGYNYRLTEIQAALGLSQLKKLDGFLRRRREVALAYDAAFRDLPHVALPQSRREDRERSGLHLYCLHVDFDALGTARTRFMARLRALGIGSQVHYIPIYRQPWHAARLASLDVVEKFPVSERHYRQCLSIPLHPGLSDADVSRVIAGVKECLEPA